MFKVNNKDTRTTPMSIVNLFSTPANIIAAIVPVRAKTLKSIFFVLFFD